MGEKGKRKRKRKKGDLMMTMEYGVRLGSTVEKRIGNKVRTAEGSKEW